MLKYIGNKGKRWGGRRVKGQKRFFLCRNRWNNTKYLDPTLITRACNDGHGHDDDDDDDDV